MGLDITAYTGLEPAPAGATPDDQFGPGRYYFQVYVNPDFPGRCDLPDKSVWTYLDRYDFRAGSYHGYNKWRDKLAELAGYPKKPHRDGESYAAGCWENPVGPFAELIHFSDCEGTMSGTVCAKLARDFDEYAEHMSGASVHIPALWRDDFMVVYEHFREAYRRVAAASIGAVDFH